MTNFTAALPVLPSGHEVLGEELDTILDLLTALADGWTAYDPSSSWTASGSNPAIGNGTAVGAYKQIGKTVDWKGIIVAGSTTTFGSGNFRLGYPITPTSIANTASGLIGQLFVIDASGVGRYVSSLISESTSFAQMVTSPTTVTANLVTATVPMTWTTSDRFGWWARYEVP